ncbi:GAD-like domain-containing protein [Massilia rhizosphaerae]|uniref:GAD-like domain-containing protein n=1 Tax=Massilia rhizosphaerae TaxID=2784389 RepID=UPI0018DCAEC5|nr:GAD-like domain-containing protein [Massilia rhizosphaerae]
MRDEDFEYFVSKFGEATNQVSVPVETIEKWRTKLPDQLLTYWQEEGWGSYANGLFWIVNPDDYEDLVDEWLEDTLLEQIDAFHVVGRTAFGNLYVCGEHSGVNMTISGPLNAIFALPKDLKPKSKEDQDWSVKSFIGLSISECDLKDESGTPLFEQALAKLGPLAADEMYGFEPAIVLGGKMRLENLVKLKLDVHLTILRQLASPTLPFSNTDIEKLLKP